MHTAYDRSGEHSPMRHRFDNDPHMAFDRSMRRYDEDGRLHLERTSITKSNVCEYKGREIPKWRALELDPDKTYKLLRDPKELERAVATFNNIPVLNKHVPVTALAHHPELVVGSTGTDATWDPPYLDNSIVVWAKPSISKIEDKTQRELSSAYYYDADMTPGKHEGEDYDGVMRNIRANHVALVPDGRAGPDVVVADSKPTSEIKMATKALSRKAAYLKGAVVTHVLPLMAQDAKIPTALNTMLADIDAKNWQKKQADFRSKLIPLLKPLMANDANADSLSALLDCLDDKPGEEPDPDMVDPVDPDKSVVDPEAMDDDNDTGALMEFLKDKLSPEDHAKCMEMAKPKIVGDDKPPVPPQALPVKPPMKDTPSPLPKKEDIVDKPAMDAALEKVRKDTIAEMNAIAEAKREVHPFVGDVVLAMDSASDVYKVALEAKGVDLKDVHPSAYRAMVKMLPKPGSENPKPRTTRMAMDYKAESEYKARGYDSSRLKRA